MTSCSSSISHGKVQGKEDDAVSSSDNKKKALDHKIFLIGGGIANFTDVAATFTGLIKAIKAFREDLKTHRVKIWVSLLFLSLSWSFLATFLVLVA
jgi:ATP citrate lyase citrate-binding